MAVGPVLWPLPTWVHFVVGALVLGLVVLALRLRKQARWWRSTPSTPAEEDRGETETQGTVEHQRHQFE